MSASEGVGYGEGEEPENEIEALSKMAVGKAKIEIDRNALGILRKIKDEISADDISDNTYSSAIRRLHEYYLGLREVHYGNEQGL